MLEVLFVDDAALDQLLAEMLDRVALLAHFGHFLLGAVLGGVGHGMAAIAVGLHLQDDRALAGAAICHGFGARLLHRFHIHAVHLDAGNVEGDAALGEIGHRAGARHAVPMAYWLFSIT